MMSRQSKSSKEKSLATDDVSMATLLPASLHPYTGPQVSKEALISSAASQSCHSAKNKPTWTWINPSTLLCPPANQRDFIACMFLLHGKFSTANHMDLSFPDESHGTTASAKWILTPLTSKLQRKDRQTVQNTSLSLSSTQPVQILV